MDGASEVISKPPPLSILNGHIPHLDNTNSDDNTTANIHVSDNEALTDPLSFNGTTVDTNDSSDPLNRTPLGSEVSVSVGLPELPFPLPNIDGTLINSEFSLTPSQIDSGDDGGNGAGFLFDSSVFNDDLVNSAIWSIGGDGPLPNLGADVPQDLDMEGQSEFSLESSSDSGASLQMLPEDNISEMIPPKDGNAVAPKENVGQAMPPDVPIAPFNNVVCMEDGFEDDFSMANPNPFVDSHGMTIDPFLDLARNRALSTITEGFEEEDEFSRSGSFNPSSLNSVLSAFAEAHEFVRLNSDPNSQQWKESSGWVNFDMSTAAETIIPSSDWSNQDDAPPTPTPTAPGGLEENIGSPVSDGNQIGVSPETVEGGPSKPVGDSWQSVSNEEDVIRGKTPSSGGQASDQHEASAKSSVIVSQDVTSPTCDKVNPSDTKFSANLEAPQTPERVSSPDSDASGEYMKLADLHISPVSAVPPASVGQEESLEAKKASAPETTQSPESPRTITTELRQIDSNANSQSNTVSESTSDSHSNVTSRTGTGITVIAGAVAAASANVSIQGSTDDTSITSDGENRDTTPAVQASEQDGTQNQSSTAESSTLNTSTQSQELLSENDQTSSSLDTGDRSRTYSNLDRGTREPNLDSSNLDAGLRARKDQPSTPPSQQSVSHPATNLPVLSPLSPEHGTELNQQYEFLRRTLSHSQRRYSQRRKQQGEQGGKRRERDLSATVAPGGPERRRNTSSVGGSSSGGDVESRRKQTVGQLRDLLRNSENTATNHNHEGWCTCVWKWHIHVECCILHYF